MGSSEGVSKHEPSVGATVESIQLGREGRTRGAESSEVRGDRTSAKEEEQELRGHVP